MGSVINDVFEGGSARAEADRASAIGRDNANLLSALKPPTLEWENYNPEAINPELIDYQQISEDPAIRAMQMRSLEKLSNLSDTGLSSQDELGYLKAQNQGSQFAKAGTEAALQSAAARGVSGGGLEFALREAANQGGAQRAQEAALQQAADAAKQRANYDMAYNSALGSQRGQDFSANRANADIINQYNAANTGIRNTAQQNNVAARNAAQQYNQEGRTNLQQQNYENDFNRRQAIAGANNQLAQTHLANSAASRSNSNALFGAAASIGGAAVGGPAGAKAGSDVGKFASGAETEQGDFYRKKGDW